MPGRRRKRIGRPTLLTPESMAAIVDMVRGGRSLWAAAEAMGMSGNTVTSWYNRGSGKGWRPATAEYVEFYKAVKQAKGQAVERFEGLFVEAAVVAATRGDVKPIEKWLERNAPHWKPEATPSDEVVPSGPAIQQTLIVMSPEDMREYGRRYIESQRGEDDVDDATRAARAALVTEHRTT